MLSLQTRSSNGGVLINEKMFYASVKYKQGPGVSFFAISTPTIVNELKPNIEDYSDSECASKVNENYDESRYPQTIYHVQCTTTLEQTCHQATKVVHILRRTGTCKEKETCEYKSDVMNVQTVCVKVQNHRQQNMSRVSGIYIFYISLLFPRQSYIIHILALLCTLSISLFLLSIILTSLLFFSFIHSYPYSTSFFLSLFSFLFHSVLSFFFPKYLLLPPLFSLLLLDILLKKVFH